MNIKELASRLEIEEKECREFLFLFQKTATLELSNLERALKMKEVSVVERLAHSIKGAAGILGLTEIQDAAKKIERSLGLNQLDEIQSELLLIKKTLEAVTLALNKKFKDA